MKLGWGAGWSPSFPKSQILTEGFPLSLQPHPKSISYRVEKGTATESSREIPMSTLPRK